MAFIIHSKEFEELKQIERVAETVYKRRTIKVNLIDRIKESVNVRWDRLIKVEKVIDEIMYRLSDRGFCFTGREKLAEVCGCSLSTVDKAIRFIKESDLFVFCYRHNPKSNGYKTPVIIATIHKNYKEIRKILGFEFTRELLVQRMERHKEAKNKEENKVESTRNAYLDWLQDAKQIVTNIFTITPEINKYTYNTELIKKSTKISTDNIVRYIHLKIKDYQEQGGKIEHLNKFVEKTFAQIVKNSGIIKGVESRKNPSVQRRLPKNDIVFYNWLEN
ncbi:hypothetical protein [Alkalihalobacillus sp. BA299]|uniref:hypothetical protein n=1 Tax=Alkalihalobacillus sp. BA299 TaxID=2815938 RepID=UPI001ADBBC47|nr:hypothetical protein [Alkalihalobacillus sp. BA299]